MIGVSALNPVFMDIVEDCGRQFEGVGTVERVLRSFGIENKQSVIGFIKRKTREEGRVELIAIIYRKDLLGW